ncbi:PAS domain S-box protein [bacterium]|nr:PAS domain S-box protein [bacterium]
MTDHRTKKQLLDEIERLQSGITHPEPPRDNGTAATLLEESEQRYKRLVDHLTDYVYTVHIENFKVKITVHGPGCEAVTGYKPEEYEHNRKLWIDMVAEEDKKAVRQMARKAIRGKSVQPIEHRIMTKQGQLRWVRNTIVLRRDEMGQVYGYDGLINEITQRKRAEESLLSAEGRYRSLINDVLESVRVAILILDPDHKIVWANRWFERFFGLTRMRVIGVDAAHLARTTLAQMFENAGQIEKNLTATYEKNSGLNSFQCHLLTGPNRKERWLEHTSQPILTGLYAGGRIEQYSDITAYKLIIQEITESDERHRQLLHHLTDYIYTVRVRDGKALDTFHGPGCYPVTGYSQEDFQRNPDLWIRMVAEEDREIVGLQAENALKGIPCQPLEHRIAHKDGSRRWVRSTVALRYNDEGRLIFYDGLINDITERKKAEELAEMQRQQLMQADKMATLGILVTGVAHEINNPNNFILLNTKMIRKVWKDAEPVLKKYMDEHEGFMLAGIPYEEAHSRIESLIEGIAKGSDRIQRIVESLKNFARLDSGDLNNTVRINEVLEAALLIVHNLIKKSTNRFTVYYGDHIPEIKGNFQKLEQVMINLITNSCQAITDRKKGLTLTTRYDGKRNQAVLTVRDEGQGISRQNMKHIFDPFFTTKREGGGTGLGLSIAFSIIKDHGGECHVESEPDQGTTVTICLPCITDIL